LRGLSWCGIGESTVLFAYGMGQLAGAALALNRGFLGLHRFDYRNQICEAARKEYEAINGPVGPIDPWLSKRQVVSTFAKTVQLRL
jgi:hypothetical protein